MILLFVLFLTFAGLPREDDRNYGEIPTGQEIFIEVFEGGRSGVFPLKAAADKIDNLDVQPLKNGDRILILENGQVQRGTMSGAKRLLFGAPVGINSADVEDLIAIPGIGRSRAEAIVAFREMSGPFKRLGELKKVRGIGEKRFEKIKIYISL